MGVIGWYAFRHLYRSAFDVVGTTEKAQQGHADPATTRAYGHDLNSEERRAVESVAALPFARRNNIEQQIAATSSLDS